MKCNFIFHLMLHTILREIIEILCIIWKQKHPKTSSCNAIDPDRQLITYSCKKWPNPPTTRCCIFLLCSTCSCLFRWGLHESLGYLWLDIIIAILILSTSFLNSSFAFRKLLRNHCLTSFLSHSEMAPKRFLVEHITKFLNRY